jgi:ELWxxDGT repeat protein
VSSLTPVGPRLYFVADAGQGQQLWVTDGTRAGTKQVRGPNPSAGLSNVTAVGHELPFTADASQGAKLNTLLCRSDGTTAGTVPVPMPADSVRSGKFPYGLASYDGALDFGFGDRLMKTSGSRTTVVRTFATPGSNPVVTGYLENLTVAGGLLYFTFPDASQQGEDLYATNGAVKGTTLLKDFMNPSGSDDSLGSFTAVGSRLFVGFDDPAQGPSLWVSDGTPVGPRS